MLRTDPTLCTSTQMTALDPGWRFSGGRNESYSGVPNSYTLPTQPSKKNQHFTQQHTEQQRRLILDNSPVPNNLTILGGPSNAEMSTVILPFSLKCEIVSTPLPVKSSYHTWLLVAFLRRSPLSSLALPDAPDSTPSWGTDPSSDSSKTTCIVLSKPLGETFTCPDSESGAVATQNIF